jgi:nuclear-control-of-ATPase protein 2
LNTSQLRCLDIQLDKLQLIQLERVHVAENFSTASTEPTPHGNHRQHQLCPSEYAQNLQRIIRQLGVASNHILSPQRVLSLLMEANISHNEASINADSNLKYYEQELEWLLLNKATLQTYGIVLNSLIDQTIPLSRDLFYWDEVMSSYRKTAFYWLQTSPWRLISTLREIYMESMKRLQELREMERPEFMRVSLSGEGRTRRLDEDAEKNSESLSETAKKFYGLVKNTINDQANFHRLTALSPFSLIRHEILQKQATIRKLREMQASALGILIGEGLSFGFDEDKGSWRGIIERAVLLMENVVRNVVEDNTLDEFEEKVFIFDRSLEGSVRHSEGLSLSVRPTVFLSTQLQEILCYHLPNQTNASRNLISAYGRPSRIIRYWIPATALLLSSTTILRILVNRQAALKTWFTELGTTTLDFWTNWVVEPIRKIIDTIRHNENSEVALMSRKSLAADMERYGKV